MKKIVCEMCGGNELLKQDGTYTCQNCGTKYSVEEAKKMVVTIDNSAKLGNALKNARRAMNEGDYEQAEKYYNLAKIEEADNWEINFFCIFSKIMQRQIPYVDIFPITNGITNILKDIKKLDNTTQQNKAIKEICQILSAYAISVSDAYKANSYNFYEDKSKCADNLLPFPKLLSSFGKKIISEFGKNEFTDSINIQCRETALKIVKDLYNGTRFSNYCYIAADIVKKYTNELGEVRPLSSSDIEKGVVDTIIEYLPWIALFSIFFAVLCFVLF